LAGARQPAAGRANMILLRDDNPSKSRPLMTMVLITVMTLVFLWQIPLG
jgi:hypothetical protein